MIEKLQNHIIQNFPFLINKKLLIAVSGGLDSMVLLHLFNQLKFKIAVAHCNFMLRENESDEDEQFIENYSYQQGISFFKTKFCTKNFAKKNKISIQIAARKLRYDWFYELLGNLKYDYILTAHHADDSLESFIINLSRGTGIDGLIGIPEKNNQIIRPLLIFSRDEINKYADENKLKWREDSSNSSDKYLRNKIRHHLIPVLKDINPNFLNSFLKTQNYLQETKRMVDNSVELIYQEVAKTIGNEIYFDINKIKKLSNYENYLYLFLNKYGFSAWNDINQLIDCQSGKKIFSDKYLLLKDRGFLILSPINFEKDNNEYLIPDNKTILDFPLKIAVFKVDEIDDLSKQSIYVDNDKLKFPIILKHYNEGDVFQPFGMNGKSKKVSKFLKDEKISSIEKQRIWTLSSDNQIVWIVGLRQDERFKIDNLTKNILKITVTS